MSSNSRTPTPYEPETHLSDPDAHDAKTPPSDALSIAELITDSIPRFDHQTLVVQPYEEEVQREQEFQRSTRFVSLICFHTHTKHMVPTELMEVSICVLISPFTLVDPQ